MVIRKARLDDLGRIMDIYHYAQDFMIASGNPNQWSHVYPKQELIEQDIADEISYVLCDGDIVLAVFALLSGDDPTYDVIDGGSWPNDEPYITIHRSASDGSTHGVFHLISDFCKGLCDNVRVDTHEDNRIMQKAILKEGYKYCGVIYQPDGTPRLAYQWCKN
ncbi:MAG TPA: N-acetyltransferase [Sphaerochaeta sp.]|nr:N-acetyltransferase [Sphaerochaeta sp.]